MTEQGLNRRIKLAAHPRGLPAPSDFRLDAEPIPEPADGQVLLRTLFLSIDPYHGDRHFDASAGAAFHSAIRTG